MPGRPNRRETAAAAPRLSIVIATYNRIDRLKRCIDSVRQTVLTPHELVIVDGGSPDGSAAWLARQPDVRLIVEAQRGGCCRAYNLGFRAASGHYVTWLNDDAYPLPGAFENAIALIERPENRDVGLVALYHNHSQPWNELHGVHVCMPTDAPQTEPPSRPVRFGVLHVRGYPYANFGLLRRDLLERLGYLDEGYYYCAWDPDLSLRVQREAGLLVLGAPDALVHHEEHIDERKAADAGEIRARDNARLFEKWALPPRGRFPDPRPAYCRRLHERQAARLEAAPLR